MESWKWLLPGWNWTIDCVRFGGDWANSIFYLILLYFNHIARNVRIVQNEKLHKLIFHYEVSLYRALERTSLTSICCSDQLWLSSNGMKPMCKEFPPCWAWRSLRHIPLPGAGHAVLFYGMTWIWRSVDEIHSLFLWCANISSHHVWANFACGSNPILIVSPYPRFSLSVFFPF